MDAKQLQVTVTRGEYKGHPLLKILKVNAHPKDKGISFGLQKARLILSAIKDIEDFVAEKLAEQAGS